MSENRRESVGTRLPPVSDEDIDRAARSLVAGQPSPRLHGAVMRGLRQADAATFSAGRRWRLAFAGTAAVLALATAVWMNVRPSPAGKVASVQTQGPGTAPQNTTPGVTSAPPPRATAPGVASRAARVPGNSAGRRLAGRLFRTGAGALPAWPAPRLRSTGEETVDLFLDVAPLELPPLLAPAPVVIAPVVVSPIEIPQINISPVGESDDTRPGQPSQPGQDEKNAPARPPRG
jgi:hypothetical protein